MSRWILVITLLINGLSAFSSFKIEGNINNKNSSQSTIYLALLNHPQDFSVTSSDFIVHQSQIDSAGHFVIQGDDLPQDMRFYRLYIPKLEIETANFSSPSRSSIYLIMNNQSEISISTKGNLGVFDGVTINGSTDSQQLLQFEKELFLKKAELENAFSKNKLTLAQESLKRHVKKFIQEVENPLIGLFALYQLTDHETDFLNDSNFYLDFQTRLQDKHPKSDYFLAYNNHLKELVQFRNAVCQIPDSEHRFMQIIVWIEFAIIIALIGIIIFLFRKRKQPQQQSNKTFNLSLLTVKEREIIDLIASGKTNKEIALHLHVELSTVKTHLNNIYKKMGVSNRLAAVDLYQNSK